MLKEKQNVFCFWAGIAAMLLTAVPGLILRENSIFTYHDQLDGELIAYMLQARHLFSGDTLPEFMGGMSKTALTLPAPACVLLFLGGNGLLALMVMQLMGRIAGFVGMYLLSRERAGYAWIGALVGVLYGLLPFLPVYGLSQYGLPLLFWCGLQLRKGRHLVLSYCYVAVFALTSSLVLVGFGLLGMGGVLFVWDMLHKRRPWHFLAAWQLLFGIYVGENFPLIAQLLGMGESGISHKSEYVLEARPFWGNLLESLWKGGQHSEGYHGVLVSVILVSCMVLVAVAVCIEKAKKAERGLKDGRQEVTSKALSTIMACLGWNVFLALVSALWSSGGGIGLRGSMGALGAFQLDRLLWVMPCLWYLAAACGLGAVWDIWKYYHGVCRLTATFALVGISAAVGITGVRILLAGDIKSNIQKLRNPDYGLLDYGDYYALGVMEQVREFLTGYTGMGQDAYRVVSLGIDPAAALYHGFYCLDGYSNHYSLDYKHKFRRIISPELERSEYLKNYFDQWGNRCYLFSSECPGYYTIEKNGFSFQDYRLDGAAVREMGGRYLLSAAYIQNATSQGLKLLNETPFETQDSYYRIFVYEILDQERKQ